MSVKSAASRTSSSTSSASIEVFILQGVTDHARCDGPGLHEFDGGILRGPGDAPDQSADPQHAAGLRLDTGRFRLHAVDADLGPAEHAGVAVQEPREPALRPRPRRPSPSPAAAELSAPEPPVGVQPQLGGGGN